MNWIIFLFLFAYVILNGINPLAIWRQYKEDKQRKAWIIEDGEKLARCRIPVIICRQEKFYSIWSLTPEVTNWLSTNVKKRWYQDYVYQTSDAHSVCRLLFEDADEAMLFKLRFA